MYISTIRNIITTPLYNVVYNPINKEVGYSATPLLLATGNTLSVDSVYGTDTRTGLDPYVAPYKTIARAIVDVLPSLPFLLTFK